VSLGSAAVDDLKLQSSSVKQPPRRWPSIL
jgi:hypothetical protein